MRKWIRALTLIVPLSAAFPAMATIMTGADGPLVPATDYTLPYRADGLFDFSVFNLGSGMTVRFDQPMRNVTLLSLSDILIAGAIDAIGIDLALETPGQIVLTGSILADNISLRANAISLAGDLRAGTGTGATADPCLRGCVPLARLILSTGTLPLESGGDVTLRSQGALSTSQLRVGGDITLRAPTIFAVPEPATPWLITLLLPMLALFGRKRA